MKAIFKPKEFNLRILPKLLEYIYSLEEGEYEIKVGKVHKRRSLNANAYFHLLVGEISDESGKGFDEVKKELNTEYGTLAKDENGKTIGFMLPNTVNPDTIYKYTKWFDKRKDEKGNEFDCYLVFKETHNLDSKEMAKLINGTIQEAETLGINCMTPQELSLLEGYGE